MKKILVMLFCIAIATSVFASGTRVASFGDITFGDAVEVGVYPGLRTHFTNYFSTTMKTEGDDNNYTGGIAVDIGSGVFSVGLNNGVSPIISENINHSKVISFMYGIELGGLDTGAKLIYGGDCYEDNGLTEKGTTMGLGLGLSNSTFDFGLNYTIPKYNWEEKEGDNRNTVNYSDLGINFRYLPFEIGGVSIIPEIKFTMGTESYDNEDADGENTDLYKETTNSATLNTIIGYDISDKTKAIFDIQLFGMGKDLTEYDSDYDPIIASEEYSQIGPLGTWKVGVESNIKTWLVGRCGAVKNYSKTVAKIDYREGNDIEITEADENFKLTFGLAFKFGKFTIDTNFNEELLFTGPNFISGAQQDWASAVSVKYIF